ncbi:hypothetical protein BDK92_2842 [Micromonospora pisi]|uniref:Lipoprotein LprG n=1 Tax=Micromonospora pisi TaxID=589240 RepID=A0A495JJE5_9ACTN|nr:hypothetical protein [Micromonospora pisi]RKR88514.1 hypothetical protein BDK92_2842 [Micromonospora pisi]
MRIRRSSVTVLVSAALLVPGIAACEPGGAKPVASQGPATSTDAKAALLASTLEIAKGNFSFAISSDSTRGEGVVHLPSRSARMKMTFGAAGSSMAMDMIYIGTDGWAKIEGDGLEAVPGLGLLATGKYHHLDKSRIEGLALLDFDFEDVDPAGAAALTQAVVDVRETTDDVFTGNIDLTKATDASLVGGSIVKDLGPAAAKLPFEAKVDAQGRLTQLTIKVPAAGATAAQELQVSYSDYGAAPAPKAPPADQVVEAPAELYELLK